MSASQAMIAWTCKGSQASEERRDMSDSHFNRFLNQREGRGEERKENRGREKRGEN